MKIYSSALVIRNYVLKRYRYGIRQKKGCIEQVIEIAEYANSRRDALSQRTQGIGVFML